ncbi:hypothetical protein F4778DRAFT_758864 [Xylariomycetidae sp. FL2044]|nr:hypothetical protein F4778DRAFT_758864 [Xylariomycetidae sp. FL2044]
MAHRQGSNSSRQRRRQRRNLLPYDAETLRAPRVSNGANLLTTPTIRTRPHSHFTAAEPLPPNAPVDPDNNNRLVTVEDDNGHTTQGPQFNGFHHAGDNPVSTHGYATPENGVNADQLNVGGSDHDDTNHTANSMMNRSLGTGNENYSSDYLDQQDPYSHPDVNSYYGYHQSTSWGQAGYGHHHHQGDWGRLTRQPVNLHGLEVWNDQSRSDGPWVAFTSANVPRGGSGGIEQGQSPRNLNLDEEEQDWVVDTRANGNGTSSHH